MSVSNDINRSKRMWEQKLGWDDNDVASTSDTESDSGSAQSEFHIQGAIQAIGGAVIAIAIVTVVVNEVLTTGTIQNSTGPFSSVVDQLETTGVSAMGLLVVGLLVAAASRLMSLFSGGF